MFHVFAWKAGHAEGGVNDLVTFCLSLDDALSLAQNLLHTGTEWETHITDERLTVLYETASLRGDARPTELRQH